MRTWNVRLPREVMAPMLIWGGLLFLGTTGIASWVGRYLAARIGAVREAMPGLDISLVVETYARLYPALQWTVPVIFPVVSLLFLVRREMPFRALMIYLGTAFTLCAAWCGWTLATALVLHSVLRSIAE